jgi:hypothetical protein
MINTPIGRVFRPRIKKQIVSEPHQMVPPETEHYSEIRIDAPQPLAQSLRKKESFSTLPNE